MIGEVANVGFAEVGYNAISATKAERLLSVIEGVSVTNSHRYTEQ